MQDKSVNPDTRREMMLETPIPRLVTKLALPTIASMLISAIYNMADTYFVSQISQAASGAVGIVLPLMLLIQAIGFTLGAGSGSSIARLLGANDEKQASQYATTGFLTSFGTMTALAVPCMIFVDPLARALGATDTILPYARDYMSYIMLGSPFMASSFVLNNSLRAQGNAFWSMIALTIGGVLNIFLDPLFIFTLGMGTGGAAIATVISQIVGFAVLLFMTMRHSVARVGFRLFRPKLLKAILPVGLPSFYRQGMMSLATILLNRAAGVYGDAAIAAMSIVSRIIGFCISALIGFYQGFQPVCGFNYGAKRYDRVSGAILFSLKSATAGLVVIGAAVFIFAPQLISLFRPGDAEVGEIGGLALRLQVAVLPVSAVSMLANMSFQALGMSAKASVLAIARQGLFFIPAVLALPPILGLTGVQLAQPIADALACSLAIPYGLALLKDLNNRSLRDVA